MSDETTKTTKDDLQKSGQTSGGKGGSTSKGKLYTDDQIAKIKSDAAAEAGRQRKAAETERDQFKEQLQTVTKRLDDLERERNETRLAEARNDPDKLRTYQTEQTLSKRERDLQDRERDIARREAQVKEDEDTIASDKFDITLRKTAEKHGLEIEDLQELGISDPDVLDKAAGKIASALKAVKTGGTGEDGKGDKDGGEGGDKKEFTPDSGDGIGGVGERSEEQKLDERYPTMKD